MDEAHPLDDARSLRASTRIALAANLLFALPMVAAFVGIGLMVVTLVAWWRLGKAHLAWEGAVFATVAGALSFACGAVVLVMLSADGILHGDGDGGSGWFPVGGLLDAILDLYALAGVALGVALIILGRACTHVIAGDPSNRSLSLLLRSDRWVSVAVVASVLLLVVPPVLQSTTRRSKTVAATGAPPSRAPLAVDAGPPALPCHAGAPPSAPVVAELSEVTVTFTPPPGFKRGATRRAQNENKSVTMDRCDDAWFTFYADLPADEENLPQMKCIQRDHIVREGRADGFGFIIEADTGFSRMERDVTVGVSWHQSIDPELKEALGRMLSTATWAPSAARVEWDGRLSGARLTSLETGDNVDLCGGQRMLVHQRGPPARDERGSWALDMNGVHPQGPVPRLFLNAFELSDLHFDPASSTVSTGTTPRYRLEAGVARCRQLDEEDRRAPKQVLVLDAACQGRWVPAPDTRPVVPPSP